MADTAFAACIIAVLIGLVVLLNVSEHRRRAKLTPDERRREDDETAYELQNW